MELSNFLAVDMDLFLSFLPSIQFRSRLSGRGGKTPGEAETRGESIEWLARSNERRRRSSVV